MEYRQLGRTDIKVSAICLGTMTWGEQNSEADAHEQMDYAVGQGINFFDTAEMYPVPPKGDTQGRTEQYVGTWFKARGKRDDIVLATKIAGPGMAHIRGGKTTFKAEHLKAAVEGSLRRLQTDYIDLYQLHWPERATNFFGKLGYVAEDGPGHHIEETLRALEALIQEGKIRHVGLSNETAWGAMRFIAEAEKHGLPRMVSVQNPYNLLNRSFEVGLAEVAHREQLGLLAYSPLAFGVLSGKYLNGQRPAGARLTLFDRFTRYVGERAEAATQRYVDIARAHDLDPAQMALAYVTSRPFTTANIIGATNLSQLQSNIESASLSLPQPVLDAIEDVHRDRPNPCP